jgi:hypothetical protein
MAISGTARRERSPMQFDDDAQLDSGQVRDQRGSTAGTAWTPPRPSGTTGSSSGSGSG